jgi:hypothetical protein
VGGVLFCIGLASFGVLALASRKVMALDRALDFGDIVVLGVFAIFGAFCAGMGGLFWYRAHAQPLVSVPPPAEQDAPIPPPRRVTLGNGCAAAGVLLLMLSVLLPADWYPVVSFFVGLALLSVAHALKPCVERIEQLRKARAWERQL